MKHNTATFYAVVITAFIIWAAILVTIYKLLNPVLHSLYS